MVLKDSVCVLWLTSAAQIVSGAGWAAAGWAEEGSSAGAAVFASAASECLGWLGGQERTQHCSTLRTKPQFPPETENSSFINESGLVEFCNIVLVCWWTHWCTGSSSLAWSLAIGGNSSSFDLTEGCGASGILELKTWHQHSRLIFDWIMILR